MAIFTDHKRTVSIELKDWDGSQYSPDWSDDFYEVGALKNLNEIQAPCDYPFSDFLSANGYSPSEGIYEVDDIERLISVAQSMILGTDDFDTPSPYTDLFTHFLESVGKD